MVGKRKYGDLARGQHVLDWQHELTAFLITGGVSGRTQSEISKRFINHARAPQILNELEALMAEDKVQRFDMPTHGKRGRPYTVWRATTNILK